MSQHNYTQSIQQIDIGSDKYRPDYLHYCEMEGM
ncbi:hypothetical protein I569_00976 [Enterococcus dispar ATCC 51266]|uniref:Uncharacterized protein n=1 Tax=Enterococcus dispar ATCC 51266 TaxID=1139219 RepID=S1NZU5_9ENTE|nr:hypothetical protein OMK_00226 [Enterococcus dispar ATCC 51266]EOW85661.1 hypothetical protein I569_00976 [Enterococcus dispar ATCC 51266]